MSDEWCEGMLLQDFLREYHKAASVVREKARKTPPDKGGVCVAPIGDSSFRRALSFERLELPVVKRENLERVIC